ICENLMDANKILEKMLKDQLTAEEQAKFDETIGLVEASIGRMVPVQTEDMKDGDPMRVCVEEYGYLPVDKEAFKGDIPALKNMVPFEPFDFYIKRKLYIHNMGHAVCAYLGDILDLAYIWESIDNADVRILVQNAMLESAMALSKKYGVALSEIQLHITDLLYRFTNAALKDTCQRVGGDPARKLSPEDRLIGSAKLALAEGICPAYIAAGAAAGVCRYIAENGSTAEEVLADVAKLSSEEPLYQLILSFYEMLKNGCSIAELRRAADTKKHESLNNVI
ncbi:MAG: mannitol dehydrogenase, partial [Christensenellaceae bacterium]|nr:mannitol dehydrogenase [Christensenellaceae bacterium]